VQVLNESRSTSLGEHVRRASSVVNRTVGLLRTSELNPGEGLWIERSPSIHMFFMRYPIDAVFVDKDHRVTKVVHDLKPWRVVWWAPGARDCLELPAGTARATNTQVGDQLRLVPNAEPPPSGERTTAG
jgi:uncharacterized membrane protein (UPF0127 family)